MICGISNRNISFISLVISILFLRNMCIAIACFIGCDVINFEIKLIFLIQPFLHVTKKPRQKFKYLENEKSFPGEIKGIFHNI